MQKLSVFVNLGGAPSIELVSQVPILESFYNCYFYYVRHQKEGKTLTRIKNYPEVFFLNPAKFVKKRINKTTFQSHNLHIKNQIVFEALNLIKFCLLFVGSLDNFDMKTSSSTVQSRVLTRVTNQEINILSKGHST